jgi:hypothetical protein
MCRRAAISTKASKSSRAASAGKLDGAVIWEPVASRLVAEGLARRVATGNDFDEPDAAFLDMRADLIKQRPDVVKGWLEAELDAEQFVADPRNADQVVNLLKAQTTGFSDEALYKALFGFYSKEAGGSPVRLTLPFAFTPEALELLPLRRQEHFHPAARGRRRHHRRDRGDPQGAQPEDSRGRGECRGPDGQGLRPCPALVL